MPPFADFLRDKEAIPEPEIPHLIRWTNMYRYSAAEMPEDSTTQEKLTSFLAYLSKRYPEWQVKQARQAVQLWIYYYRTLGKRRSSTVRPGAATRCGSSESSPEVQPERSESKQADGSAIPSAAMRRLVFTSKIKR